MLLPKFCPPKNFLSSSLDMDTLMEKILEDLESVPSDVSCWIRFSAHQPGHQAEDKLTVSTSK